MLKTLILIEETARIISLNSLQQCCRTLQRCKSEADYGPMSAAAEAVVLHMPPKEMAEWQAVTSGIRRLPTLWLCTESKYPEEMDWGFALDGVLFSTMTPSETMFALKLGIRQHGQRKRWLEERAALLQRLEERKWIDQAKAVLCEIKGISEAEAYDFLRKQAMNERKRIGDIAASIVKVYQLIHG